MNMLIIVALMAIGLISIVGAILLAMSEEKTSSAPATVRPEKEVIVQQQLPSVREEIQTATMNSQFRELSAQLRVLHEQVREIEQRLSLLAQTADHIENSQLPTVSLTQTDEYVLPELIGSAATH